MDLNGKKILFIGPIFNSYEQEIIRSLEKKGAEVDFIPEKVYKFYYYYINKLNPSFNQKIQKNYLIKQIDLFKNYYNYLFVIRGEYLDKPFFEKLLNKCSFDKKVIYQWDSVKNNKNILNIVDFFDHVYTFDHEDAKEHDFKYKALFYTSHFQSNDDENLYDFVFVGSFNYDRAKYIVDIKKFAIDNNLKVNIILYISYFRYIQMKLKKEFQMITKDDVIFKPMSLAQVSDIIKKSKVVLDIPSCTQTGLPIRIFETFGAGRKLLTNNKNIMNEDFYDENCICFFDELSPAFLDKTCQVKSFEKYHIDNWLNDFFQ